MRVGVVLVAVLCLVASVQQVLQPFDRAPVRETEDTDHLLRVARFQFAGTITCSQDEFEQAMQGDTRLKKACGLDRYSGIRDERDWLAGQPRVSHEDKVAVFEIPDFRNEELSRFVATELATAEPLVALFDLSINPGGSLGETIELICLFVRDQSPMLMEQMADETTVTFRPFDPPPYGCGRSGRGPYAHMDLVAYVSGQTASASEVFIRALPHVTVVGLEPTFGKASVQSGVQLNDGKTLRLTTGGLCARDTVGECVPLDGQKIEPDLIGGWNEAREIAQELARLHPHARQ